MEISRAERFLHGGQLWFGRLVARGLRWMPRIPRLGLQFGPVFQTSRSPLGSSKLSLPADGTELVLELGQYPEDHLENTVPLVDDFVSFESNFSTASV
jgi:hypothetical protein